MLDNDARAEIIGSGPVGSESESESDKRRHHAGRQEGEKGPTLCLARPSLQHQTACLQQTTQATIHVSYCRQSTLVRLRRGLSQRNRWHIELAPPYSSTFWHTLYREGIILHAINSNVARSSLTSTVTVRHLSREIAALRLTSSATIKSLAQSHQKQHCQ